MIAPSADLAKLHGDDFVLVPGFVGKPYVDAATKLAPNILKDPDESTDDGIHLWHFPFNDPVLDNLMDSSGLLDIAIQALGTDQLRLSSCMLWARRAEDAIKLETRFHRDYADNALVAEIAHPDAVGAILYLSDVAVEDGPTWYLPRSQSEHLPIYPRWIAPEQAKAERLHEHEIPMTGTAGTLLLQTLFGVHRASRPTRPGVRITLHAVFRRADAAWLSWSAWPRLADTPRFRAAFIGLSDRMRQLLGWPNADWPGWADPRVRTLAQQRFGIAVTAIGAD